MESDNPVSREYLLELEEKFAPFVRKDIYGVFGMGELPITEKFLIGVALITLVPLRLFIGMSILLLVYVICWICTAFSVPNRHGVDEMQQDYAHMVGWRRSIIVFWGKLLSRAMLVTMGFYWINETNAQGLLDDENSEVIRCEFDRPGAIISNHVSYLDILYHISTSFPSFVAKRSVASLPLVGLISKCLGCIYVEREEKPANMKGISGILTERILAAHYSKVFPLMMLFPEGTTTNGNFLLPFKTGAFLSQVPVLPVIIRYPYQRFSPAWDSISGVRHMILLLCQFVNYMDVIHLPTYFPSKQEKDDPRLYANNVRKQMAIKGKLALSYHGLSEKREYLATLENYTMFLPKTD